MVMMMTYQTTHSEAVARFGEFFVERQTFPDDKRLHTPYVICIRGASTRMLQICVSRDRQLSRSIILPKIDFKSCIYIKSRLTMKSIYSGT